MTEYKINKLPHFHIMGRYKFDVENDESLALFWAGSSLELNVKTSEVWAEVESDYDTNEVWLCVWINGRRISRFMAEKGKKFYCLTRGLNPEKENRITLMRDTQPMSGDSKQLLKINSISVSDGTEFCPVQDKKLKIEFIGDSITSGEGTKGGPDEWDWISQWISVSDNYAVQTATALNADFNIISQCGWGVISGWDNNFTSIIPPIYDKVCGLQYGENQKANGSQNKWDFSLFRPDVIVVNLGTNDNGAFSQPAWKDPITGIEFKLSTDENGKPLEEDALRVSRGIADFLSQLRKNNPESRIIWVWGMIDLPDMNKYLEKGVEIFLSETGDKKTESLILPSMNLEKCDADKGSRGHPGPLTHRLAAEKLIDCIKNRG